MEKCCKQTFQLALEQVLFTIRSCEITDITELCKAIKYGIELLEKTEEK